MCSGLRARALGAGLWLRDTLVFGQGSIAIAGVVCF